MVARPNSPNLTLHPDGSSIGNSATLQLCESEYVRSNIHTVPDRFDHWGALASHLAPENRNLL